MVQLVNLMDVTLLLHLLCVKLVTLSEAMWDGISSQLMGQSVRPATLILEETYIRKVDPSPVLLLLSRFSRVRLCPTPDCSPPGSAIPGILQARTLEWVAISFSSVWKWKVKVKSPTQSCPTLHDPMDFSLPGSSIHGIFQARLLPSPKSSSRHL